MPLGTPEEALRMVTEAKRLAFDTETDGLDPRTNRIIGYAFAAGDRSIYVPVHHSAGGNIVAHDEFERALAVAFRARRGRTIGHNLKFDMRMAANQGISLGFCEDTFLNEALINEHADSFSLEACAARHHVTFKQSVAMYSYLAGTFGGKPDKSQMANFHKLAGDDAVAVSYACADALATLELAAEQHKEIEAQGLGLVWELESDLIPIIHGIEQRGMRVDAAAIEPMRRAIEREIAEKMAVLPANFNVRSSKDMLRMTMETGRLDYPKTEKGNPSFTEKWLKTFEEGSNIVAIRKLSHLINTFIDPLEKQHLVNGRVHSKLNQLKGDEFGTISGRFSSNDPNMQQVPKHNKDMGRRFRSLFVPDDGMDLYEADYSQCEPRLFAHYTESSDIIQAYREGLDLHDVAAKMLGVPRDPIAKRMNMGILNGMWAKALSEHMGWSLEQAKVMLEAYHANVFPKLKAFQELAASVYRDRGYIRTLLGRRCRIQDARFAYQGVSRIIQGGNADIIKWKMRELAPLEGDDFQMLMTVHDSFVFQARSPDTSSGGLNVNAKVVEAVRIMEDVQSPPFSLKVPFKVDVHSGKTWAEATYGTK